MPMDRKRYPSNWEEIAKKKKELVGWKCEVCGKQCRKPGEEFDTHKRTRAWRFTTKASCMCSM